MKSLSYLNKYFLKYRWHLLLGIVFIIILNYFGARMPVILGDATQSLMDAVKSKTPADKVFTMALLLAGTYVLFSIIKGFFLFLTRQMIIVMSRRIEYDLKNEIYTKYQELDYNFYKSQSTGDLMNRISEDVSQVRQYLGPGIMYTVNLAFLFPFVSYQMAAINPELTIYVLLPLPIMMFLIYRVSRKMNNLSKEVQQQQSRLSTIAQESFSGIRVIKAYIQEAHTRAHFDANAGEYHSRNMKLVMVNALFMPTITFLIGASIVLSIYIGGLLTYSGEIKPGNIITFIGCVTQLTWPFASVGWVTSIIQRAAASQQRINEFLLLKPVIVNPTEVPNASLQEMTFDHVTFRYPGATEDVLKDISFTLKRGETLGIIGKTGCGKSTLTHLLLRQLDPVSGEVRYNNQSLKTINLDQFRKELGVVPQDVFLFSDSIRNNIAFSGRDSYTEAQIEQAAEDAHVLHNIRAFEQQFETLLGERGVNLSGGQKQRISIARALIRKPQLLVLDDCLSAVDTETEEIILRNLRRYSTENETTTVIVSHRISSLRNADRILVLDEGRIAESGTHEALLASGGLYAQLHEKQLQEEASQLTDDSDQ